MPARAKFYGKLMPARDKLPKYAKGLEVSRETSRPVLAQGS